MRRTLPLIRLLLAGAIASATLAQEPDALWTPDGYRLVTMQERQTLRPEELKEIQARNTTLLREAIERMSPDQRRATAKRLAGAAQKGELTLAERQYVTMTTMMLTAPAGGEKKAAERRSSERARYERVLREQLEVASGFPSDSDSVVMKPVRSKNGSEGPTFRNCTCALCARSSRALGTMRSVWRSAASSARTPAFPARTAPSTTRPSSF
jgi:hypothetical protein